MDEPVFRTTDEPVSKTSHTETRTKLELAFGIIIGLIAVGAIIVAVIALVKDNPSSSTSTSGLTSAQVAELQSWLTKMTFNSENLLTAKGFSDNFTGSFKETKNTQNLLNSTTNFIATGGNVISQTETTDEFTAVSSLGNSIIINGDSVTMSNSGASSKTTITPTKITTPTFETDSLVFTGALTVAALITPGSVTVGSGINTVTLDNTGTVTAQNMTTTNLTTGTLNFTGPFTAPSLTATTTVVAGTTITAAGNIDSTSGIISAGGSSMSSTAIISGGSITAGTNISATSGTITGSDVTATDTLSGVTLNVSGLTTASGGINAGSSNITTTGNMTCNNITAQNSLTVVSGAAAITNTGTFLGHNILLAGFPVNQGRIVSVNGALNLSTAAIPGQLPNSIACGAITATSLDAGSGTITTTGSVTSGSLTTGALSFSGLLTANGGIQCNGTLDVTGVVTGNGLNAGGSTISNASALSIGTSPVTCGTVSCTAVSPTSILGSPPATLGAVSCTSFAPTSITGTANASLGAITATSLNASGTVTCANLSTGALAFSGLLTASGGISTTTVTATGAVSCTTLTPTSILGSPPSTLGAVSCTTLGCTALTPISIIGSPPATLGAVTCTSLAPTSITGTANASLGAITATSLNASGTVTCANLSTGSLTFSGLLTASGGISTTTVSASGAITADSLAVTNAITSGSAGINAGTGPITNAGAIGCVSVTATGAITGATINAAGGKILDNTGLNLNSGTITNAGTIGCGDITSTGNIIADSLTCNTGAASITITGPLSAASITSTGTSSLGNVTAGVWNGTGITVASGGTGVASLTPNAVLCGGTTSTGAMQSVVSLGNVGEVLTSNGAGALPTFQSFAVPMITTGTYTPVVSFPSNCSGIQFDANVIPQPIKYQRVGNLVTIFGSFIGNFNVTGANRFCFFVFTSPINPSIPFDNFTSATGNGMFFNTPASPNPFLQGIIMVNASPGTNNLSIQCTYPGAAPAGPDTYNIQGYFSVMYNLDG